MRTWLLTLGSNSGGAHTDRKLHRCRELHLQSLCFGMARYFYLIVVRQVFTIAMPVYSRCSFSRFS